MEDIFIIIIAYLHIVSLPVCYPSVCVLWVSSYNLFVSDIEITFLDFFRHISLICIFLSFSNFLHDVFKKCLVHNLLLYQYLLTSSLRISLFCYVNLTLCIYFNHWFGELFLLSFYVLHILYLIFTSFICLLSHIPFDESIFFSSGLKVIYSIFILWCYP